MKTILYVDDEVINLQLFKYHFKSEFNIETAINGEEGLEVLDAVPEIVSVISDFRMPKMDGLEFIKKAKVKYPSINFYILTGYDITNEMQEALENKVINKYFQKPFDRNEVILTLSG